MVSPRLTTWVQYENGIQYVKRLETMFKDIKLNEDDNVKFKDHVANLEVCRHAKMQPKLPSNDHVASFHAENVAKNVR